MKFKNIIKSVFSKLGSKTVDMQSKELAEWLGLDKSASKLTSEVTYFTCMKMLAETMGKLPIKFYQDTENGTIKAAPNAAYNLLRRRPNRIMAPTTFWSTVENNRNHYGNAYVWIRKEFKRGKYGGSYEIKDLWIMPSNDVEVILDNKGIFGGAGGVYYYYSDRETGKQYIYSDKEVMHFKTSMSFDGILGLPVSEMLRSTVMGGLESQKFINKMYEEGLSPKLTLQYTGDLDPTKEAALVSTFEKYINSTHKSTKIVPVPIGMQLSPMNLKLTDSQFFELKKHTALQIAGAFGIKPNQINNYEKSSYSNSEMQQLSFYVDTALFNIKHYEEIINYYLLDEEEVEDEKYYKFNENVILRTDAKTQKEILCAYVNNGIYKVDEARGNLNLPKVEGGDITIVNGNYIPLDMVGEQYKNSKGGT